MNYSKKRNEYFDEMAQLFKLLGTPVKLKLLNFISFCPRTVEDCARKFDQSVQNTSLHLIAMAKAGILDVEQIKNFRYYSLSSNPVTRLVEQALAVDCRTLLPDDLIWAQPWEDLISDIKHENLTLVDLRAMEEASFIPINCAIHYDGKTSEIGNFLKSLPKKKPLLFFCKGAKCERLAEAVTIAKNARFEVKGLPLSACELKELGQSIN